MAVGTTLSRTTGFARLAVMAWAIGATESKLPDTYQLANTLPNVFYQLVLGEILVTVFVPVFVEYLTTRSREEIERLSSTILTLTLAASFVFSAAAVAAAPWIIKIYSFRLHGAGRAQQEQVGAFFLRLFLPQMIFYSCGLVISGLLNAHRRFAAPAFAPIANNLIVIATFVSFRVVNGATVPSLGNLDTADKLLLGLGTTAGVVVQTILLFPSMARLPGRWWQLSRADLAHPALSRVGRLARFALAYVAVNQIGLWIVKALANGTRGGVAAYDNSFTVYSLPYGIFAVSVFTAMVPTLSEQHARGDIEPFRDEFVSALRMTSFLVLPASAGFVALSRPLMRLLFEHGVFGSRSTDLYASTFGLMAIGLWAYAVFQQMMRALYSMQDTRTPWLVNSAGVAVNVATAIPLYMVMGVPGLGLSHAVSYLFSLGVGASILRRRLGGLGGRPLRGWLLKVIAASVLTGVAARLAWLGLASVAGTSGFGEEVVAVGGSILAGVIVYFAVCRALDIPELGQARRLIARALGRA